jgi:hypothetical protein
MEHMNSILYQEISSSLTIFLCILSHISKEVVNLKDRWCTRKISMYQVRITKCKFVEYDNGRNAGEIS